VQGGEFDDVADIQLLEALRLKLEGKP